MANRTVAVRAWELLQQMEVAFISGQYAQASALADMARSYQSFPSTTDDDLLTVWFSHAANSGSTVTLDFTVQTVTGAAAPTAGEVVWDFGDGRSTTITTKALTTNVATLTYSGAHGMAVGQQVLVAISDAVFDGLQTITGITTNTITFAKVNANVTAAAATGTAKPVGLTFSRAFPANGTYPVTVTVDTAALTAVSYLRYVKVPYSLS
jgi:hypothetical protein